MDISEVRIKLVNNPSERLKAFCSITLDDDFVIRDLKVIDGANGTFVAMPSRKLADRCQQCGHKNHLRARFCNECGKKLGESRKTRRPKTKLHADIAHPINAACRERIQSIVVDAYNAELEKSKLPGYKPADLDDDLYNYEDEVSEDAAEVASKVHSTAGREHSDVSEGTGYDDLIADLKKDAEVRRSSTPTGRERVAPPSEPATASVSSIFSADDLTTADEPDSDSQAPSSSEGGEEFGSGVR